VVFFAFGGKGYTKSTGVTLSVMQLRDVSSANPSARRRDGDTTTWSVNGTGDFNADGSGDILWRDSTGHIAL
jgi:hypothetical protein